MVKIPGPTSNTLKCTLGRQLARFWSRASYHTSIQRKDMYPRHNFTEDMSSVEELEHV